MKNCSYCGRGNEDYAGQCGECGTSFDTEVTVSQRAKPETPNDGARAAEKRMFSGALWCVGGILVTLITYFSAASSPSGGTYIVAWGAIVFGALQFFQGLFNRNGKPSSVDTGYEALGYAAQLETKGRVQEALVVYQKIIEKYPDTDASNDAKKSIESLMARQG
jgi:hypothetical protein